MAACVAVFFLYFYANVKAAREEVNRSRSADHEKLALIGEPTISQP